MPKFRVLKYVDAYVVYKTVVVAPDRETARALADEDEPDYEWSQIGAEEYDDREFPLADVEQVEQDIQQQVTPAGEDRDARWPEKTEKTTKS